MAYLVGDTYIPGQFCAMAYHTLPNRPQYSDTSRFGRLCICTGNRDNIFTRARKPSQVARHRIHNFRDIFYIAEQEPFDKT